MLKTSAIALGVLIGFTFGFPTSLVALTAGAVSLFTRRVSPEQVYALIDWTLLLMFAGLFVVVAGAERTNFQGAVLTTVGIKRLSDPAVLATVVTLLSNLVSNVPAVMVLRPFYALMGNGHRAALIISSASTFAGNLTVPGSIANLIVIEQARRSGIEIGLGDYMRVGVPVTILTLIVDVVMLSIGS
jgi:Na+/H+ antiporter NhaD/arsenite permease-like protein